MLTVYCWWQLCYQCRQESFVSNYLTAPQLTDMPAKLWALLQSQPLYNSCYALTFLFATKHADFPAVMQICIISNRCKSRERNNWAPCRQSSFSPRTYRHGICLACARLAWGTSAMAFVPTRESLTCSLITERPGSTWHKPERRSDGTSLYKLSRTSVRACA